MKDEIEGLLAKVLIGLWLVVSVMCLFLYPISPSPHSGSEIVQQNLNTKQPGLSDTHLGEYSDVSPLIISSHNTPNTVASTPSP